MDEQDIGLGILKGIQDLNGKFDQWLTQSTPKPENRSGDGQGNSTEPKADESSTPTEPKSGELETPAATGTTEETPKVTVETPKAEETPGNPNPENPPTKRQGLPWGKKRP